MQFQKQHSFELKKRTKEKQNEMRKHSWRSTNKEHRVNALALGAEEGRDKLRKATFRSTYPLRRGCPNGETRRSEGPSPLSEFIA